MALITNIFVALITLASYGHANPTHPCRSYCGNITIDYPFALQPGCGHPGFKELLFCINDALMLHISSGSYRVLDIDYAYQSLTLHDPHMSNCDSIVLGRRGNGFVVHESFASYLNPTPDNVFMLIGCSPQSPLFQGFPGKHFPCQNVSGMGCEEYYGCPAWDEMVIAPRQTGSMYGSGPPECCAVSFEAIKAVNLSKLGCEGYSSAYNLAPLRLVAEGGAFGWSYGIRVKYNVQGQDAFCKACEATGGSCGYNVVDDKLTSSTNSLCLCIGWNSTSNCDSVVRSTSNTIRWSPMKALAAAAGLWISVAILW